MLKDLLKIGDAYANESTWKDFAVVKICLGALGLIAGLLVPEKHRQKVIIPAFGAFIITYIPLMIKTVRIAGRVLKKS